MRKKVLTETALYFGKINSPKNFEIDRQKIKKDILISFVEDNKINDNPISFSFYDYKVPHSKPYQWLKDYIEDFIRFNFNINLIYQNHYGNIFQPNEQSFFRNQIDPVDLRNSPDYTLIYAVEVEKNSCELLINYDDNRRKNRTRTFLIEENNFYMFPSINNYCITANKSNKANTFLTITYAFI